ncbi:ABC transporter ATP-binding protein [Natronorubrum tibetense]|uniref:Oligopeptide/dipeptide ABC transporter, ATPase subunit n=1 Tax=Natronorubrum tibetense GA33 TaxID=1114856 RepID=L9VX80_9EURY|nr:ABC transporter ATP-binding protein [Natronorubrum tibetense]ELY41800.1 oligopeptide/dipeptide ABC transporter, ATPase subunit [Natronorubrum tibetense GA33]
MSETRTERFDGRDVDENAASSDPDTDPVMELRDATVTFEMDRGRSRVLDGVTLEIERNEILGVVGESGSGKSMLASALMNAIPEPGVLEGEIRYNPEQGEAIDVTELSDTALRSFRWDTVSMVFQGAMSSFNPVRKIETSFVETFVAHDVPVSVGMERARGILEDLSLDPERVFDAHPHELSGGMKQRALIALSLVLEPDVLVMDEPTAALDLLMQQSIIRLLSELKETYDLTIVFITHDIALLSGFADRLAVMYAFDIVELGPTNEVLKAASHPYTRALLTASPNLTLPLEEMAPINGRSPDPVESPAGCSYAPRCPLASEQCRRDEPQFDRVNANHRVGCHHWKDAADVVSLAGIDDGTEPTGTRSGAESVSPGAEGTARAVRPETETGSRSETPLVSLDDVDVHFRTDERGLLDRFFGTSSPVRAVDGVSLDIYADDVLVIVGESGCGKSTLGKTAIGLQEPTAGRVEYRGQHIWNARRRFGDVEIPWGEIRRNLQIVHQDPGSALNPNRKMSGILAEPLKRWRGDKTATERRQILTTLLREVGITPPEDYLERYPHQLSGGEQQRVALVRAFLTNPDLIFADEPVSALDVSLRVEIMDLLIRLQDLFGTSFLMVSHDLANARYMAGKTGGRIGVMYLGELVEIGTPDQVLENPQHPYTQALRWATPELYPDDEPTDPPVGGIDVPDATNVPSGCRYRTRCEYAREICTARTPSLEATDGACGGTTRCFRPIDDHDYWDSPPLETESDDSDSASTAEEPR